MGNSPSDNQTMADLYLRVHETLLDIATTLGEIKGRLRALEEDHAIEREKYIEVLGNIDDVKKQIQLLNDIVEQARGAKIAMNAAKVAIAWIVGLLAAIGTAVTSTWAWLKAGH